MKTAMTERIIILQRLLPHYRVGFFKKFCLKFPETKIIYGQPYKDESLKNSEVTNENFIKVRTHYFGKSGRIFLSNIFYRIFRTDPEIIISVFNVGNLNIYILFVLKFFLKYKIILWSFGYDPVKGFDPKKRFSDKLRLYLSQKADAVIFYWNTGMQEVSKYSKKTNHYFIAPNTLDTDRQFELKEKFDKAGRDEIKKELGIIKKNHFIYVGRMLEDKEADRLLRAFKILEENNQDCHLSLIGTGPELNNLIKLSEELNINNINFEGEILDEETTGKWIYASDAFVMPGRLGLSVVHSFCFGTPIISQRKDKYFHGEGIGYVKDGLNGFLVEDGNIEEIAQMMSKIIHDQTLYFKLRTNAFETVVNECSASKMLLGFEKAISYAMSK